MGSAKRDPSIPRGEGRESDGEEICRWVWSRRIQILGANIKINVEDMFKSDCCSYLA